MNGLAEWALTNLAAYSVPILLVLTYIGSLGIPFPITCWWSRQAFFHAQAPSTGASRCSCEW
jgi:hypothetical protein